MGFTTMERLKKNLSASDYGVCDNSGQLQNGKTSAKTVVVAISPKA